jgi:hypothetical protein
LLLARCCVTHNLCSELEPAVAPHVKEAQSQKSGFKLELSTCALNL